MTDRTGPPDDSPATGTGTPVRDNTAPESRIFFALSDHTRRQLLDSLFMHDGQRACELGRAFTLTRQGLGKHLSVLESAGLVTARRAGRETTYHLNRLPLRQVHSQWLGKFADVRVRIGCT